METPPLKILLVEDDEEDFLIVQEILAGTKGARHQLIWAPTYEAGLAQLESGRYAAVLVDYSLGGWTGLEFIREVTARGIWMPIIFLTGQNNYEVDLQAMQAGAADYLTKADINPPLLERSIRYAIERKQTELKLRRDAARSELLSNLTRDFTAAGLNYLELVNNITRRISEAFGDAIIIRVLSEDGQTLEPTAVYHPEPLAREKLVQAVSKIYQPISHGVVGEVARSMEPRLLCDTPLEELVIYTHNEYRSWFEEFPVDSIYVAPLCSQTRLTGTLAVIRNTPSGHIEADDQAFYLDIASRAALAIENARLHSEVELLAQTDSLTGLLNRRGFAQFARRELDRFQRYGSPLSIIILDIDHFKNANDTHGHAFGDEVLIGLAEACSMNIRKMDIASRYGGDEFLILLPETDLPMALHVANRIRTCFANYTFASRGEPSQLTISMGVSTATGDTTDLEALVQRADRALYHSKHKGRNRVETL